jgi:hypothetical protein
VATAAEATVSDLDAPGVPDGAEDRLLVVPANPANLDVVVPTERAGSSRGDPTVHQDQLEPAGDALPVQVLQNQRAGPRFSWVEAGAASAPTGRPVTSTATMRLTPLVRP